MENTATAATRLRRRHVTRVTSRNAFSSRILILIAVIMSVQSSFQLLAEHPTLSIESDLILTTGHESNYE